MLPKTIIVVPCYNEGARLNKGEFIEFVRHQNHTSFLFVNDGSTDDTSELLESLSIETGNRCATTSLSQNSGKAEAVRQGVLLALASDVSNVGFWDADLATPLSEIQLFNDFMTSNENVKMVCGNRIKRLGANIDRKWTRHYPGRVIATMISFILQLPTYDTQCGAKIFERGLAEKIFHNPFISQWLFDVELFARVIEIYGKEQVKEMIYEFPLHSWSDVSDSKIKLSYLPKIPFELMKIRQHYKSALA